MCLFSFSNSKHFLSSKCLVNLRLLFKVGFRGWRDGSAVKNNYCFVTGPGFDPSTYMAAQNCL